MYRILRSSRISLFLHRKSNHVFTMWQHLVLLAIRQYEGKSYRMFIEWLVEAHYLRLFLGLSQIPHFTTLQKFTDRINNSLLEKIISSFIVISGTKHIFVGIDSTGFKITHASQYYTERTATRRKYAKLSIGADVLQQIICTIKIRRAPTRHDNIDFKPIITRASNILPLSYRKQMKRGYSKLLYNQRNKDETIMSVIKRLFGEHLMSRLTRTQNRELSFKCITYNMHRLTNLIILMMFSTKP